MKLEIKRTTTSDTSYFIEREYMPKNKEMSELRYVFYSNKLHFSKYWRTE